MRAREPEWTDYAQHDARGLTAFVSAASGRERPALMCALCGRAEDSLCVWRVASLSLARVLECDCVAPPGEAGGEGGRACTPGVR